jgi:hypothetical protein
MVALVVLARKLSVESAPVRTESGKALRFVAAGVGLLTLTSATMMNPSVEQAIYDRGAMAFTGRVNEAPLADDALRVAIAGSSAPLPSASRAKASVVVFAGGRYWVIDSGPESTENLVLWGVPLAKIAASSSPISTPTTSGTWVSYSCKPGPAAARGRSPSTADRAWMR